MPRRALGAFLVVVGILFVGLWLGQILAAIPGGVPDGLFVYDIPSTVPVLDLAFVLPLMIATGLLAFRRHRVAPILGVLLLGKMFTLGLALLSMNRFVAATGGGISSTEPVIWRVITVASGAWLGPVLDVCGRSARAGCGRP